MLVKVEFLSKLCENFNKLRLLKKPKVLSVLVASAYPASN